MLARSPTGRELSCPVQETDGVYTATFQPDEAGEWSIAVTHGGEHIQGGPFTCFVYDPNAIKVSLIHQFDSWLQAYSVTVYNSFDVSNLV